MVLSDLEHMVISQGENMVVKVEMWTFDYIGLIFW